MAVTELVKNLREGKFVLSIQIDPPAESGMSDFRKSIDQLGALGVRVFDINDRRKLSFNPIILAMALANQGFTAIPHLTARDSSPRGLAKQVMGATSLSNVRDYLVITGDAYTPEENPSPGVFHTDSVGALQYLNRHLCSKPESISISFSAAVNQNKTDKNNEGKRLMLKEQTGVEFFASQPVFDQTQIEELIGFYKRYSDKPLLVGIFPLFRLGIAEKIWSGGIPGIILPDDIYNQARALADNEHSFRRWGKDQVVAMINALKNHPFVSGAYVVAPLRNPLELTEILRDSL